MNKNTALENYLIETSSPEDPILSELYRKTHLDMVHPQMAAGHLQGKVLEMISRMIRPDTILEIGTFTGYSAICLAKGLSRLGKLFTIEKNDEWYGYPEKFIKQAGLQDRITLLSGDARVIIPGMKEAFDLVYLDAEKDEYTEYYELVVGKVKSGGFIMADNVLWGGKVLEKPEDSDYFTRGILGFVSMIKNDDRVEQVILPVRDGIMLIRKK